MIKYTIVAALLSLVFRLTTTAQLTGAYEEHFYIQNSDTMPYRLLLPVNYDVQKKYPLIIFLHGSGERGNNNTAQLYHGGNLFLNDSIRKNFPAIVVFPQCAANDRWANMRSRRDSLSGLRIITFPADLPPTKDMLLLQGLIKYLEKDYPVDKTKLYAGGLSLGGMGTYDLVRRMPGVFAAAFPICGAGNPQLRRKMKKTSWWIFHGQRDSTVYVEYGRQMAEALKRAGAHVKLTIYPDAGHNSWDSAFVEPGLFTWMFSNKLKRRK